MMKQQRTILENEISTESNLIVKGLPEVVNPACQDFDEKEETTKIKQLTCLQVSCFKRFFLVPLLSLVTGCFFLLFLYWYPKLRKIFFYRECSLSRATYLFVVGVSGNEEVIDLINRNQEISKFLSDGDNQIFKQCPLLTFEYRFINFKFDYGKGKFLPIIFNSKLKFEEILSMHSQGIKTKGDYQMQLIKYGQCDIQIPKPSIPVLFMQQMLHPFYIFQVYSVILWYTEDYWIYAICIIVISAFSIIVSVIEQYLNMKRISQMAHFVCNVKVMRNGKDQQLSEMSSSNLVPGDVIEIPENEFMPCDVLLLTGTCIVNESMLTGESIPVMKNQIPQTNEIYDPINDQKYTLYSGTKIIQTRKIDDVPVFGLVLRTGFITSKGGLVRDILYPKPNKFKFYRDSMFFVGILFTIAIIGFLATIKFLIESGFTGGEVVKKSLDLITIAVPPILPSAMAMGTIYSLSRLKKSKIYCIQPPRINVSGRVNLMVFDKTGTLTEEGLQVYGFRGLANDQGQAQFNKFCKDCPIYQDTNKDFEKTNLYIESMASCHSITYVNKELIGDPLDVRMFGGTNWILDEQTQKNMEGEVILCRAKQTHNVDFSSDLIRRFDFSSKLQRMSVIVQNSKDKTYKTFVKGSPEIIKELSIANTIPINYDQIMTKYTQQGFRVIALGYKNIQLNHAQAQRISRDEVEKNIGFLGFLIMQNRLKEATTNIIKILNEANVRTIMATGDNVLTAISVGKESNFIQPNAQVYIGELEKRANQQTLVWRCTQSKQSQLNDESLEPAQFEGQLDSIQNANNQRRMDSYRAENIVDDVITLDDFPWQHPPANYALAITGKAFNHLISDPSQVQILNRVIIKAQIYARMSPDDKAVLVEQLQTICKTEVGMCGDGANDCIALKTADIGVSLSEAEASIAAPFTSQIQDISCIVTLLREGRCALTTSFQCFKFIGLYSMIQFSCVVLLYPVGTNLSNYQFLFQDLIIIVPLAIFMGWTGPYEKLTPYRPAGTLMSLPVICSLLGATLIQFFGLFYMLFMVKKQDFYVPYVYDPDTQSPTCYEQTTLFLVSMFEFIVCCIAFSRSKPFRKPLYSNPFFTSNIVIISAICLYIIVYQDPWLTGVFEHIIYPREFIWKIIVTIVVTCILIFAHEKIVIYYITRWWNLKEDVKHALMLQNQIANLEKHQYSNYGKQGQSVDEENYAVNLNFSKNEKEDESTPREIDISEEGIAAKNNNNLEPKSSSGIKKSPHYNKVGVEEHKAKDEQ